MRIILIMAFFFVTEASYGQNKAFEKLYYHSPKGLTFIPPLSRPGLVYNGKLYIGKKQLETLFNQLKNPDLDYYFDKYKANKTSADVLTFLGSFALPLANIFISTNQGRVNWWLLGSSVVLNGTGSFLNIQAQKHLLLAAAYYDKKNAQVNNFVPQQQSIGFTVSIR
jgi:hypothetical protein